MIVQEADVENYICDRKHEENSVSTVNDLLTRKIGWKCKVCK